MLLAILAIAWILGIVAADLLSLSSPFLGGAATTGLACAALGWRTVPVRLLGLCMLCMALGGLRYEVAQVQTTPESIQLLADTSNVIVQGRILSDPKRTEEGQQVTLQTQAARVDGVTRRVEGLLLLSLPPYPAYRYGQQLAVMGDVRRPREARRPGEFDYRAYLERKGIFVLMREPLVQVLPGNVGNTALKWLLAFRDHCRTILLRELPEPQASLAVGILLGLQSSIPDEVYNAFSATGTSHILVVSGWNFTIVAAVLAGIAPRMRLGRAATFWVSLGTMWTYALFVGANAAVLRAAVMASLVVLARTTERRTEPWTLLLVACAGMSLHDPQVLWDLGFQLSALATASLFAFAQPVEQWLHRCPPLRWPLLKWATEALTATLAAQILALPLILYQFGNLSIIAPLSNVLMVPVVPYTMLLGTIALVAGLIWLPLGQWLALTAWLPLTWLAAGAQRMAALPWAAVHLPPFPLWLLLSYYGVVVGWWLWGRWAEGDSKRPRVGSF